MKFWILVFILPIVACTGNNDDVREHTDKTSNYNLSWLNHDKLLVRRNYPDDSTWIYSLSDRQQTPIHFPIGQFSQLGAVHASPNGEFLFTVADTDKLLLLPVAGIKNKPSRVELIPIPPFTISERDRDEPGNIHGTTAFWSANDQIYFEHYNLAAGKSQCHLYHVSHKKWQLISHCIGGPYISHVSPLGWNLYATYISVEGDGSRKIVQWDSTEGVNATVYPEILSGRMATLDFFFDKEVIPLYALSSHVINAAGEVLNRHEETPEGQPLTLYQWTAKKGFESAGFHVPAGAALQSIASKKITWLDVNNGKICASAPQQNAVCYDFNLKYK
jgi:hypothetical protein